MLSQVQMHALISPLQSIWLFLVRRSSIFLSHQTRAANLTWRSNPIFVSPEA